jgi:RES domain-containing protein
MAWRLDAAIFSGMWDSGEGAFRYGGRWNSRGVRAVYASLDPAAAILEVAVHKGFKALDTVPHVLTAFEIDDPGSVHVVAPEQVPNPNWLRPCPPSAGQQAFGDALLARRPVIVVPSAVSTHSWNLILAVAGPAPRRRPRLQERFALDTRLHPPAASVTFPR